MVPRQLVAYYGDLWHPVFQLKVLSSSSIYEVCYAENE